MAKDPAFLFYPGNWLKGTQLFSRSHKGAYMDILMAQFSNGHLSINDIKQVLGVDYENMWESKLKLKFKVDDKGLYYNDFMENVMIKREEYTKGRINNLKGEKSSHKGTHKDIPYGEPICSNATANTIKDIIAHLNLKCNTTFRHSGKATQRYINARIAEGFSLDDFKRVINFKSNEWINKPDMNQYLRPETLFGTKFEGYLQAAGSGNNQPNQEPLF
jgi:uncharacterized phage protein (TIGR02220 family)